MYHHAEQAARLVRAARARIRPQRFADTEATVHVITKVLASTARRRRDRRTALVLGIAAAASTAALALTPRLSPAPAPAPVFKALPRPQLVAGNGARAQLATVNGIGPLPPGHTWRSEERLRSQGSVVTLAAEDGTTIEIAPWSDLKLLRADTEQWLRLGTGSVMIHVAKLEVGQRFVVVTPDAEVEVRGTRFQVALGSSPFW